MASFDDGFGQGCGCVLGVILALALVIGCLVSVGSVVQPCLGCANSGKCARCNGSGAGRIWGTCDKCGGNGKCHYCNGSGWLTKK